MLVKFLKVLGVPVPVDVSVYADASAGKEFVPRLFVGDAFVLFYLAASWGRTLDSFFLIGEKQPVRPVYPVGYVLYRLTSHITPVAVFIRVAKVPELFLEFVFIQKLPCFGIVILYDGQSRVVWFTPPEACAEQSKLLIVSRFIPFQSFF